MEGNIVMDRDLKRSIILDNYQNANKKYISDGDNYEKINTRNVSCIDNLDIYIDLEDNISALQVISVSDFPHCKCLPQYHSLRIVV